MDELLLSLAYFLNILALLNKYRPWIFFIALTSSVLAALLILVDKLYPVFIWTSIFAFALMCSIVNITYEARNQSPLTGNFMGQMHESSALNFFLLILGLSIIGMPGLGLFFIWSRLEHALIHLYPGLILSVYVILTLNTIVFFRFYYVNFLGKYDALRQIKTVHS